MTISGSGSMIDVNGLVTALMKVERQPLARLESREAAIQSRLSAFGRVQSALSSLESSLAKLALGTTFTAGAATTTGEGVAAAVGGTPANGRYAISITQLARVQSSASAPVATATTDIGSGTVTIRNHDGSTVLGTFIVGDNGTGTLTELRDEINGANIGVRASLVNDAGQVRLVLNAAETGVAKAFQVETDAGLAALAFETKQAALDARYSINGLALTSSSNVIKDAIEGLTLTLTKAPPAGSPPGTTVDGEVVVSTDTAGIKAAVQEFVKAYNDFDKLVGELTKYDPNTKSAAILNGEGVMRQLQNQVRSLARGVMTAASGDFTRLSDIGIAVQTDGTLKLDESKFDGIVNADPAKVARLLSKTSNTEAEQGFAVRLRAAAKSFISPNGALDARQKGLRESIRSLDQQQERMEARLSLVEARLRRQYSQLDALLATSQSQSNALANALSGLPSL